MEIKRINLNKNDSKMQLSFFNLDDPKLEEIKGRFIVIKY